MDLSSYHGYVRNSDMWADVSPTADHGWRCVLRSAYKGGPVAYSGVIPMVGDDGSALPLTSEQASRIALLLWNHEF